MWFRVNEQLPVNLQKSLPDRQHEVQSSGIHEGEDISLYFSSFNWQTLLTTQFLKNLKCSFEMKFEVLEIGARCFCSKCLHMGNSAIENAESLA